MALKMPEKAFPVSWDEFHRDSRALAWRLSAAGPFQAIVAITRGGLVPAGIVARELNIRLIETVCVASYDHISQGELKVLKGITQQVVDIGGGGGKGVLIVDDLVDTGRTAKVIREMLPKAHPDVMIGSYPFMDDRLGPNTNVVVRARDPGKLAAATREVAQMLERVRAKLAAVS